MNRSPVSGQPFAGFPRRLVASGLTVPRIVAGGTPSFSLHAQARRSGGRAESRARAFSTMPVIPKAYRDFKFQPAALLFTRVVSRPTADRVTVDLGTKSVASDPPVGVRVVFPALPDAVQVAHNEEHLVLKRRGPPNSNRATNCLAVPRHICPTVALHKDVHVFSDGKLSTVGTSLPATAG